jgi:hypothetical protein
VSGLSLNQRSPTECGVSECDRETSIMRTPWPTMGCCAVGIIIIIIIIIVLIVLLRDITKFRPSISPTLICILRVIFVVSSSLLDVCVPAFVKILPNLCVVRIT